MFSGEPRSPGIDLLGKGPDERLEFLKAWLGTTIAFTIASRGQAGVTLVQLGVIMAITAGLGIVLHELAHRVAARRFGSPARFIANDQMLLISIALAFTGFLFAAPGAVWHNRLNARATGIIAAAGPVTNMALAVIFLLAMPVFNAIGSEFLWMLAFYGYFINALLGLFNMIPFGPLDGAKVMEWDMTVFVGLAAIGGLLFVFRFLPFAQTWFALGF